MAESDHYEKEMDLMLADLNRFYRKNSDNVNLLIDVPRIGQACALQLPVGDKDFTKYEYFRGN